MPKRARSETIVDFMEPPVRIQRVATAPDSGRAATSGGADTGAIPLQRTNAIYQPLPNHDTSQAANTAGTQEDLIPAVTILSSLSGGGTSYEGTPSTIVGTQNDDSQLTGNSIE